MSSQYDTTEFVDSDFQAAQRTTYTTAASSGQLQRAPSREEVDSKVGETQQKLAELRRAQEELERERAALEETRRRQTEFQSGRQEMLQNLTRGVGLLEEAEFAARRDAEQMAKAMTDLRDSLAKLEAIQDQSWTKDNFTTELTRALTVIENARLEWNSARLKFTVLDGASAGTAPESEKKSAPTFFAERSFGQLCKLGLAMTWPLAVIAFLALAVMLAVLLRH